MQYSIKGVQLADHDITPRPVIIMISISYACTGNIMQ